MPRRHLALLLALAAVAATAGVLVVVVGAGDHDEQDDADEPASETRAPRRDPVDESMLRVSTERFSTPPQPPAPSPGSAASTLHAQQLVDARRALEDLAQLIHDRNAMNEEILFALDEVMDFYVYPAPPRGMTLRPAPHLMTTIERHVAHGANIRRIADARGWSAEDLAAVMKYRRAAERLFLKALTLYQAGQEPWQNARDAVNIRAAQVLGATENHELTSGLMRAVDRTLFRAEHHVPQQLLDEVFNALGQLSHHDALMWMVSSLTSIRNAPRSWAGRMSAAYRAMIMFDREIVRGNVRLRLVMGMVQTYAAIMARGALGELTLPIYLEEVESDAIKVVQYFSFDPVGPDGAPLETMEELSGWFGGHRAQHEPPWTD